MKIGPLLVLLLALSAGCGRDPHAGLPRIGYVQLLEDPQLDAGRAGFLQALADTGLVPEKDVIVEYRSAQGDQALLPLIVQGFLDRRVRIIATATTPAMLAAAQVTAKAANPPPVVITIVSPPDEVGLATVPTNMTGWYCPNDMATFLGVVVTSLPAPVKRLGLLNNPAEPNAVLAADKFVRLARDSGIEVIRVPVASVNEITEAASSLAARDVQAFIATNDNTVYNAMPVLARIAEQRRIPIFAADAGIAQSGAAVGWGLDYRDWGYQSGVVAAQLLRGATPREVPLRACRRFQVQINETACARQGLVITESLRRQAAVMHGR